MAHANKKTIKINSHGQAIIESLVIIKIVIALTILILSCTYFLLARKWAHYWVYRTALCQTHITESYKCRQELKEKLEQVLPRSFYRMEASWVTRQESHVAVQIKVGDIFHMPIHSTVKVAL